MTLPVLLQKGNDGPRHTGRYLIFSAAFCVIYLWLPVKTCLYVAMCAALIGLWEKRVAGTRITVPITLLLMSPVAQNFGDAFSFPLRLWLTKLAGTAMNFGGVKSTVAGNVITSNGSDFSVDPACMGLHMLITSLLCGMLLVALWQQKLQRTLRMPIILCVLLLAALLNVLANLIRIILLVQLHLLPQNPMHGITGIACLLLYVLLPLSLIIKWLLKKFGSKITTGSAKSAESRDGRGVEVALLIMMASVTAAMHNVERSTGNGSLPQVDGYTSSWYDKDIVRLQKPSGLVYIKRLPGFYFSEHNPMLCWVGSGFTFSKVSRQSVAGLPVCTGILQKDKEKLYTAWWYDNGQVQTSGSDWRWKALNGTQHFSLVNVTASTEEGLVTELRELAASSKLKCWLSQR